MHIAANGFIASEGTEFDMVIEEIDFDPDTHQGDGDHNGVGSTSVEPVSQGKLIQISEEGKQVGNAIRSHLTCAFGIHPALTASYTCVQPDHCSGQAGVRVLFQQSRLPCAPARR